MFPQHGNVNAGCVLDAAVGTKVQRWLRHPRFNLHFTPTSSSWLNMVERFLRDLTQNRRRRGVFRDPEELIMAIGDYIDKHNLSPTPCCTAKASDILEKALGTLNRSANESGNSFDAFRPN